MPSRAAKVKYPQTRGKQSSLAVSSRRVAIRTPVRKSYRRVLLGASFIGSFLVAYIIVLGLGSLLPKYTAAVTSAPKERAERDPFAEAVPVTSAGWAVRVPHQEELNPHIDKSFLFTVWLKLSQPLVDGKRVVVVAKFGGRTPQRPGYALALNSGPDGVRPQVYWQDESGRGRWLTFASVNFSPEQWMVLGLSFRDGRYVGLHSRPLLESGRVEVLGGYDLQGVLAPRTKSDLLLGSFSANPFIGAIGPVGVFQGAELSANVPKILTDMAADPTSVPDEIDSSDVVLWSSPKVDSGPRKLSVTLRDKSNGSNVLSADDPS